MSNDAENKKIEMLHGGDVYRNEVRLDYSVNLNPFPMPSEVTEAMQAGLAEINQYPDPVQQKLRSRIAVLEGVSAENVVCGNGASELLMAAVHAVMPRKALITAPCYAGYAVALKASDAEIVEYLLDEKKNFTLDDGILDQINDDIDMVFIADPNNPNGRLIEPALKKAVTAKCGECGAVLVIDECFYPLTWAGAEGEAVTMRFICGLSPRLLPYPESGSDICFRMIQRYSVRSESTCLNGMFRE